jgi:YHS domain-containing protein
MPPAKPTRSTKAKARPSAKKVYCPCCPTWEIKHPERCSNTMKHAGKTLYFCTRRCKERFAKAPEKFGG